MAPKMAIIMVNRKKFATMVNICSRLPKKRRKNNTNKKAAKLIRANKTSNKGREATGSHDHQTISLQNMVDNRTIEKIPIRKASITIIRWIIEIVFQISLGLIAVMLTCHYTPFLQVPKGHIPLSYLHFKSEIFLNVRKIPKVVIQYSYRKLSLQSTLLW